VEADMTSFEQVMLMEVACPAGCGPGSMITVTDPNSGQPMQATVPDDVEPGGTFKVQLAPPAAQAAVAQATSPVGQPVAQVPVVHPVVQPMEVEASRLVGDRTQRQAGFTALKQPGLIRVSSWELAPPTCYESFCAALRCSWYDTTRSYIYSRDNMSLEVNDTNSCQSCCSCCCEIQDNVSVYYYDRSPLAKECNCAPMRAWCCCIFFHCSEPKLEPLDEGCIICCVRVGCENLGCGGRKVVIMPFENLPPPCCCCTNRVGCCDNCCGCCGPVTGNPKFYSYFSPQPKDVHAFCNAVKDVRHGAPAVTHMARD